MKKIFFAALAAATILSSCSKQEVDNQEGGNLKSMEFSLGVATPKTRMADGTVTQSVIAAVRNGIQNITIEYFNAAGTTLGTYNLSADQIATVKSDDQTQTDPTKRTAVRIDNIPTATTKVNVYLNVKNLTNINDLQTSFRTMEYRGKEAIAITLKTAGGGSNGNDLYEVEVPVQPVLSRFEFTGTASDIVINSQNGGTLPTGITDGTKAEAQAHVSDATITAAEVAARDAWKTANPGVADPIWDYKYTVTYAYNTAYTIDAITGYYMNNIPVTPTGSRILNSNSAAGDWNEAAKASYTPVTGSMRNMFDLTAPTQGNVIAYNLFPQTFTPASAPATTSEVKANMPHFILKLATSEGPRWLTVRAFRNTTGNGLITNFEASKAYVLRAADITINQYSAKLVVTATGTAGPEIPEVIDPIDPNPEPQGKDLDLKVSILDWTIVYVKPEA